MKYFSSLFILLAGIFWGSMGVFVRTFTAMGFTTLQVVTLRMGMATVILLVGLLLFRKKLLKIRIKSFPLLASMGVFSLVAMSVLYFTTIEQTTMSVAAILLYLSPVVVMMLSVFVFKEIITPIKLLALFFAVLGCILVSGVGEVQQVSTVGLITGIGSAVAYGLYSILGTFALRKYHPLTVTFWAFATATVFMVFICEPVDMLHTMKTVDWVNRWPWLVGIGAVTAVIPYGLYTVGLKLVQPSKAAVLACSEPVAATIFGFLIYREQLNWVAYCGMAMVLLAILLLNGVFQKRKK